ncbi:hypothetical protein QN372_00055 [Undibacterium sp. RTI2.1]|uniref:hypothetical protein n=1 Tax=unclassified Undibacterium TaxID=2630295 RepID=UPI002AB42EA6|nr:MULTISPECIES: hypothetical protein [unclassified Undibacterium]MDY7537532.1 hypothetical protein [Undibacterium sp. 5I1]MEB0029130.1 hypothetical protein [Undibacterium sp. RTI2.1]MEB0115438.1 hypothetical protein [Undibacterium sp. RTI2.2]MEB0231916.1 hypothetical protein [Undibacterium sp. 10I3]MEB0256267.1 hypothetical protein [Undibacterium sp. 5I1]
MQVQVIGFIPPMKGLEDSFNTFRLGGALAKRLEVGHEVLLMDEKTKIVFGRAEVKEVVTGTLGELCLVHAHKNHLEISNEESGASERLFKYLQRVYGPHIATATKKACVLYLKRLE